jgi:tyrosine-protein phosphatase SIW14
LAFLPGMSQAAKRECSMRRPTVATLAVLLAAVAASILAQPSNSTPSSDSIPRFCQVSEDLYRGGQPSAAGFEFLKRKGIKTVVNLRLENDEKPIVEGLGMKYVQIPLRAWDRIPDEAIQAFFRVLRDPDSRPVFIHCRRGADRAGAMIGFYRIAFQGWSGQEAYDEARALGMRWWYRGLKHQLYQFASRGAVSPGTVPNR